MSTLTRRYFFLGAAAAAAANSAHSARPQSAADKVVLALIGAGGRGNDLARKFQRVENVEFKYVCEVNDENGGKTIDHLESVTGRRPQRVLDMRRTFDDKDVDGVVITTPEHWHALAAIWACQAGKDSYVEKCVSLTIWEGRRMIEAARKYKRVMQCGTQNRSAPYTASAKEYIDSGKLGKVLQVKVFNLLPPGSTGTLFSDRPLKPPIIPTALRIGRPIGTTAAVRYRRTPVTSSTKSAWCWATRLIPARCTPPEVALPPMTAARLPTRKPSLMTTAIS